MIRDKSTRYDQTVAKACFRHVWPKKNESRTPTGVWKTSDNLLSTRFNWKRMDAAPWVLLESTVSLASHSLFIVVTISWKCCQATAFHDRRNCTKGRHDVDNLRSHLLLRANQSQAWQTHTRRLTNVLDVKALATLFLHFCSKQIALIQGAARGLNQLNFVSGDVWISVHTCHVSWIVPQAWETKTRKMVGQSFLSWPIGGKNKQKKKPSVDNQSYPTRTIIIIPVKMIPETCCRSQERGLFCETICERSLTHHANAPDHAKCVWRHLNRVATVVSRHLLPCFRPWNVCTPTVLKANKATLD